MSRDREVNSSKLLGRWWALLTGVLAVALAVHFAIASCIWMQTIAHDWTHFAPSGALAVYWPDWFVPLVLGGLAVACVVLSVARRRAGRRMLAVTVLAAVAFFAVDVRFKRYQFSVGVATKEYWDSGGPKHVYYTWWWFNDRWLRTSYRRRRAA